MISYLCSAYHPPWCLGAFMFIYLPCKLPEKWLANYEGGEVKWVYVCSVSIDLEQSVPSTIVENPFPSDGWIPIYQLIC